MAQGRARKLIGRGLLGLALALAGAGIWAALNWGEFRARYTTYRLNTATGDEERAAWADALASRGEPGLAALLGLVRSGEPQSRAAAAGAIDRHLAALPEGDPRAVVLCGQLLDAFAASAPAGQEAVVGLLPTILKRGGTTHPAKCREVIAAGLKMPAVESRLTAVRAAMHPALRMRADLLPLLGAPEPEVRRVALFAVGPATDDDPVIGDEDLFRWLHDPDEGVRKVAYDSLVSRGRTDLEITLGRRLAHPEAHERLKLLLDLRYDDDVADPEPWLERLSRDPDPGVRAGAARVVAELAAERHLSVPVWVGRLADADGDPTVRRIARFYRAQPTSTNDTVRPVAGP